MALFLFLNLNISASTFDWKIKKIKESCIIFHFPSILGYFWEKSSGKHRSNRKLLSHAPSPENHHKCFSPPHYKIISHKEQIWQKIQVYKLIPHGPITKVLGLITGCGGNFEEKGQLLLHHPARTVYATIKFSTWGALLLYVEKCNIDQCRRIVFAFQRLYLPSSYPTGLLIFSSNSQ